MTRWKRRLGRCDNCGCLRTFHEVGVIRFGMVWPFIECRTCARKARDPKKRPVVHLTQRLLFQ